LGGGAPPAEAEDGLLTAEDVIGLDLLDTELVVLSACETGLGEVRAGEGVFGLRRAFQIAGAGTLVMSLWKVPDGPTQELMATFYRKLLAGLPRAEALRQAQLDVRKRYPRPRDWGAFICQGDYRPMAREAPLAPADEPAPVSAPVAAGDGAELARPAWSGAVLTRTPDGLVLELPSGLTRERVALLLVSALIVAGAVFAARALPYLAPTWFVICIGVFVGYWLWTVLGLHKLLRRPARVVVERGRLVVEEGRLLRRRRQWEPGRVAALRPCAEAVEVCSTDEGWMTAILAGRDEAELAWVAAVLGEALGAPVRGAE
jgi:hypothetical protein